MKQEGKLNMRPYQDENDFWRISAFLREVFILNGLREFGWHVARLDYWRGHLLSDCADKDPFLEKIFIWETKEGDIGAVLTPEGSGQVYLQVHPDYRSADIDNEMITVAEDNLKTEHEGQPTLFVWINPEDPLHMDILKQRGYSKGKWTESQWWCDLDAPISETSIPAGYNVRSLVP